MHPVYIHSGQLAGLVFLTNIMDCHPGYGLTLGGHIHIHPWHGIALGGCPGHGLVEFFEDMASLGVLGLALLLGLTLFFVVFLGTSLFLKIASILCLPLALSMAA